MSAPSKTSPYQYVKLCKEGKQKNFSIHRLVATAFVPNPLRLPEVDHIDRDINNNNYTNLRWTDRLGNLLNTECGMTRNFRECTLFCKGDKIGVFKSIKSASKYAHDNFGASESGMNRNLKSKGCEIKSVTTSSMERRTRIDHRPKCETPKGNA